MLIKPLIYSPHGAIPDQRGFAPSICALKQTEYLNQQVFAPILLSASEGLKSKDHYKNIPIYRYEHSKLYRRLFLKWTKLNPKPLEKVTAFYINKIQADLLHVHQLEFNMKLFRKYNQKTPVIAHAHTLDRSLKTQALKADHYIAASTTIKDHMIQNGFLAADVSVISNGVDENILKPLTKKLIADLKLTYKVSDEKFVIVFAGRKIHAKGFHTFLRALAQLKKQGYDNILGIAIGGDFKEFTDNKDCSELQALRQKLSSENSLREFSFLDHQGLNQWFNIADIVMAPSLTEAQGMVMLEAMSAGALLLSNRLEGIKISVIDQKTGILFDDFESVDQYIKVIIDVINNRQKYEMIKTQARAHVLEHYTWHQWSRKLETVYKNVLHNWRNKHS